MSVVTYRNYVMAADTRAYSGRHTPIGNKMKIRALNNAGIAGVVTSQPGLGEALLEWLESNRDPGLYPNMPEPVFDILHVDEKGEVYFYHDSPYPSGPLSGPFFAVGSGCDFALGAMAVGADAVQAAAAACELDTVCGAPVARVEHPILLQRAQEAETANMVEKLTEENAQLQEQLAALKGEEPVEKKPVKITKMRKETAVE